MQTTSFALPQEIYQKLSAANLANRSFFIKASLAAFTSSEHCTAIFIASVPHYGKCLRESHGGEMVPSRVPIKLSPVERRTYRKVAKDVAGGSLSRLVVAALHWQFNPPALPAKRSNRRAA